MRPCMWPLWPWSRFADGAVFFQGVVRLKQEEDKARPSKL